MISSFVYRRFKNVIVRLRKMININTKQMKLNLMNQDIQTSFEQNSWNLVRKHSHVH